MVKPPAGNGEKKQTTSKGKQRIPIEYIKDKEKRQVTFSKRKGGLLKKASELHLLSGAHVAIVIFSQKQQQQQDDVSAATAAAVGATASLRGSTSATTKRRRAGGNVFAMGTPSVDHVITRLTPAVPLAAVVPLDPYRAAMEEDALAAVAAAGREGAEATARRRDEAKELVDTEEKRMKAVAAKVLEATPEGRFWWEADVEALGETDLQEFGGALRRLRDNVMRRHADKLVVPQ